MRTAASVFISGTGIFEIAGSFCLQKKEGDGDNEQSKKSKVRIHVAGGIESKHGKEQKGTGAGNSQHVGEDTERVGRHQKGTFPEPECAEYRRKLDVQSQQWSEDISEYVDIKELDANLLNRLISKIVISEPQEKDGTENYRCTPETVTMEIHFNLKPIPELGTIERGSGSHK